MMQLYVQHGCAPKDICKLACRDEPLTVQHGLAIEDHDQEGRVITAEFPGFYLTTVYTPNSGTLFYALEPIFDTPR